MKSFSLKAKLLFGFGGVSLILALVALASIYSQQETTRKYDHVATVNLSNMMLLGQMLEAQQEIRIVSNRAGLPVNQIPEKMQSVIKRFEYAKLKYAEGDRKYNEVPFVEGEQQYYDSQNLAYKEMMVHAEKIFQFAAGGTKKDYEEMSLVLENQFIPAALKHSEELGKLIEFQSKESGKWAALARAQADVGNWVIAVSSVCGIMMSLLLGFILSRSISGAVALAANRLSSGADQVSSAAVQISQGAQMLSSATSEQAANLEETSASIHELSGMTDNNLKNAENVSHLSAQTKENAEQGVQSMTELLQAMNEILESNKRIEGLVKVIEEIGEKTEIIDEIVFQTKLLSFNASVEAERAGEHGRGFAVVAQEVGNLAQMSGKAATEISGIVKGSIKEAHTIASENRDRVEKGSDFVKSAGDLMRGLKQQAESVYQAANQILTASKEQASGLRQVSKAVESLNQVTQQTASNSEESAAAAEELTSQVHSVRGIVTELKVLVSGQIQGHQPEMQAVPMTKSGRGEGDVIRLPGMKPQTVVQPLKKAAGADSGNGAWENL